MANEESKGKWAAEAFDFLRLYKRVGSGLAGLILIQLGWALLLGLLVHLSPDSGPYVIGLPFFTWGNGLHIDSIQMLLSDLFPIGFIIILIVWFFSSGIHILLTRPLARFFQATAHYICVILFAISIIFAFPLLITLLLIDEFSGKASSRDNEKTDVSETNQPSASTSPKEHPHFDRVGESFANLFARIHLAFAPFVRIGVSAPITVSYDEEVLSAKALLQGFINAQGRLRASVERLGPNIKVQFHILPDSFRIAAPQRARFQRWYLGYDALLWGSFAQIEPAELWVNVELKSYRSNEQGIDKLTDASEHFDLLGHRTRPPISSVHLSQADPLEAYILLLLVLVHIVARQYRERLERSAKILSKIWRMPLADRLLFNAPAFDQYFLHLMIAEVLPEISEPIAWRTTKPAVKKLLVAECVWRAREALGNWKDGFDLFEKSTPRQVKRLLEYCSFITPENPDVHYLLAVCQCIEGEKENAWHSIMEGKKHDEPTRYPGEIPLMISAEWQIEEIHSDSGIQTKIRYAVAAVDAAILVNFGGKFVRDDLLKTVKDSIEYMIYFDSGGRKELLAGQELLYRLLGILIDPSDTSRDEGSP